MNLKKALTALTAGALTLALAACGGGSVSSGSASGSTGGSITYWASNQGTSIENDKEILTPVLDAFTQETGVTVNLEVIPWTDLQTRLQTAITSGQGPDVVNIGNTWAASLQATNAFLPFDDANMNAIGGSDKFVATALATGGTPGQPPTSLPLYGLAYGLYYNTTMLSAAGIQPPTTYEELLTAAQALNKPDQGIYGLAIAAGSYRYNAHFAFINSSQYGADLFTSDGKPDLTQPEVVDGVLRQLDLMQQYKVVNPSDSQLDSAAKSMAVFASGKAAFTFQQNNADATFIQQGMDRSEFGVVPIPVPANAPDKISSHVAGINVSILKNTKNQAGALALVKHLTSETVQSELGKPFAVLPVLKGMEPNFTDNAQELATFEKVYNEQAKPLPTYPAEDQFEMTVGRAMNSMFATIATGGTVSRADVETALQTAQDSIR